jgi:hypothetical protein
MVFNERSIQTPCPARRSPEDVKAQLLRRRDAVDAGEPTIDRDKAFAELQKWSRERNNSKPA